MAEMVKDKSSDRAAPGSEGALMDAVQAMHKLTLQEKAQLLEYLSRSIQHGVRQVAYEDMSWEEFIDMTYGSLAHDPIDLPERFKAREREKMA